MRSGKRKDRMKLSLLPKLVEKLVWVPVIFHCRIFIPSYAFDALLCWNWSFSPCNRETDFTDHSNTWKLQTCFLLLSFDQLGTCFCRIFVAFQPNVSGLHNPCASVATSSDCVPCGRFKLQIRDGLKGKCSVWSLEKMNSHFEGFFTKVFNCETHNWFFFSQSHCFSVLTEFKVWQQR
jgi:hypothetical protein